MRRFFTLAGVVVALGTAPGARAADPTAYDYTVPSADGQRSVPLAEYKGKVTLIVDIGTKSQYADQLAGLEALQQRFAKAGFTVIALPASDFADLTPGSGAEIEADCRKNWKVTFPVFGKISVRGDSQAPLYHFLTDKSGAEIKGDVHWLFTKFLVDQHGKVVRRFEPGMQPDDPAVISAIEETIAGTPQDKDSDKERDKEKEKAKPPRGDRERA